MFAPDRSHFDHIALPEVHDLERCVVQVTGLPTLAQRQEPFIGPPVPPDNVTAGAKREPVQVDR